MTDNVVDLTKRRAQLLDKLANSKEEDESSHPFTTQELLVILEFFDYLRDLSSSDDAIIELHGEGVSIKVEHNCLDVDDDEVYEEGSMFTTENINTVSSFINLVDEQAVKNFSAALDRAHLG